MEFNIKMIMNAAIQEEIKSGDGNTNGIEEIKDTKILKIIDICYHDMVKWGYRLPRDMQWAQAQMDQMGRTLIYVDKDVHLKSVAVLLNSGLKELSTDEIKDTVYHELIHVVTGQDHDSPAWQRVKQDVASRTKLKILESIDVNAVKIPRSYWILGYKYTFTCSKCGNTIGFNNPAQHPAYKTLLEHCGEVDPLTGAPRFTHTGCGGAWKRNIK